MFTDQDKRLLETYNAALALYKQRRWSDALAGFKKALELHPGDGPSKVYIERCETYMKTPPGDDWDGVFVMKTK